MNQEAPFTFMIVEDEPRIRKNLVSKIQDIDSRFRIIGEAFNGVEALEMMEEDLPDVIFSDIRMPVMDGLKLIEEIYYHYPDMLKVIISGYDDFSYAKQAIRFDVLGYLLKPVDPKELSLLLSKIANRLSEMNEQLQENLHTYANNYAQETLAGKVAEYLRSHYNHELSIQDIADSFHVNPTYMTRVTKKYLGKTPTRLLLDLRIAEAKRLLKTKPELGMKEITYSVGYTDQGYFSRIFKKKTGLSPSEYRDNSNG